MTNLQGIIETISGRIMSGSVAFEQMRELPVIIEFREAGRLLGSSLALPGDAAEGAEIRLRFEFLLPEAMFDGELHEVTAHTGNAEIALSNNLHRLGTSVQPARKPKGSLDVVTDGGLVMGWAWYPDHPEERVELEILVDGQVAGSVIAATFRKDLLDAGIGDGKYHFFWPLPFLLLVQSRAMTVTVRDKRSGDPIGGPQSFRQTFASGPMHKIGELEQELRLLNATVGQLGKRRRQDDHATTELFRTVGDFFAELADASAAGQSVQHLRTLKGAVDDVTSSFASFAFRPCPAPLVTVFVEAAGTVADIYETLRAVFETIGETEAEIFLLDHGACGDAPLLPLVVQNLRYARLMDGQAAARCNDAMNLAAGELVVFIAAGTKPGPFWTKALAVFGGEPRLGALASQVIGPDGLLVSAGVELHGKDAVLRGEAREAGFVEFAQPSAVDAVAPEMFAVRRAAWSRLGGFDERFFSLWPALVEFCLRLKAAGDSVGYEPSFCATRAAGLEEKQDFNIEMQQGDTSQLHQAIDALSYTPA